MRPLQRDGIGIGEGGEVQVPGYVVTTPAGAFGAMTFTACPVALAREVGASLAPAALRAASGGGVTLADLGVVALSEGGADVVFEFQAAWAEVRRLEEEEAQRRAERQAAGRTRR